MSKISLTDLVNLQNETTAVNAITVNNSNVREAFENTLSRDGTQPNQMDANLDMNSNHILNLPAPISADEPVRVTDLAAYATGGTVTFDPLPVGGTAGQFLKKNSSSNYDASWQTQNSLLKTFIPEDYGVTAYPYGTTSDSITTNEANTQSSAFNACIAAVQAAGGGTIVLGPGIYVTTGIVISLHRVAIRGSGMESTFILLKTTSPIAAVNFIGPGGSEIFFNGISDLTICSKVESIFKIGLNLNDVSSFTLNNVSIRGASPGEFLTDGSGNCIGFSTNGRELGLITNLIIAADKPVVISHNPLLTISGLDSWVFDGLLADTNVATNNVITVLDQNISFYNTVFRGNQNWIGGKNGFYHVNSAATAISVGLHFSGIKSEQTRDSTGFTFDIETIGIGRLYNLKIENSGGGDRSGIKLRGIRNAVIDTFFFDGNAGGVYGLDIDYTNDSISLKNCVWTTASIALAGLTLMNAVPQPSGFSTSIPTTGLYTTMTTGALATNAVTGFNYIPTCAGTPTGAAGITTGQFPMIYDSTNNKFYVYNGAWKGVTLT